MISAVLIAVSLLLLLVLMWRIRPRWGANRGEVFELDSSQREVDIGVLSLLLSRGENEFLRRSLSPREFRQVRRKRLSLARRYLIAIHSSTAQFILAAEAAESSSDRAVAKAAHELLLIALRIRLNLPLVEVCLILEWLFPSLTLVRPPKLERYREMGGRMVVILERFKLSPSAIAPAG